MSSEYGDLSRERGTRWAKEQAIRWLFFACAAVSILTTLGILAVLLNDAVVFFSRISPVAFFTGTEWHPTIQPYRYGVLPLISGTLAVTVGSAAIAIPLGVLTAIYLSEYASDRARSYLKPALEVLASVPTVVYGYFALAYITPALSTFLPVNPQNVLAGSIVVGIMVVPMISSISEDAMNSVPDSLRQAGYGMGATKFEVSTGIVVPAAMSGIVSSFILAISRVVGETMAVYLAVGNLPQLATNPNIVFESSTTMTVAMVDLAGSELSASATQYKALFAIGFTLFLITLAMNLVSDWVANRYREVYD